MHVTRSCAGSEVIPLWAGIPKCGYILWLLCWLDNSLHICYSEKNNVFFLCIPWGEAPLKISWRILTPPHGYVHTQKGGNYTAGSRCGSVETCRNAAHPMGSAEKRSVRELGAESESKSPRTTRWDWVLLETKRKRPNALTALQRDNSGWTRGSFSGGLAVRVRKYVRGKNQRLEENL